MNKEPKFEIYVGYASVFIIINVWVTYFLITPENAAPVIITSLLVVVLTTMLSLRLSERGKCD